VFNPHMAASGGIRRRLALAIVLTALIPVLVAVLLAQSMVRQTSARFFVPEVGARLDQALGVYQQLARAVKAAMRQQATAIARHEPLRRAVAAGDAAAARGELQALFAEHSNLVSLTVVGEQGNVLARVDRGRPLDPTRENDLEVVRALEAPAGPARTPPADAVQDPEGSRLIAVFAAAKEPFEQRDEMSRFLDTYKRIERRRQLDEASYVYAFAALLGLTILAAIGVGVLLAHRVSSRIAALAEATKRVGAGDLTIRVPERGGDEISDLARAFNRTLSEIEASRARIEYLQRMGAWQEMARRLAHEIKNPLTPIQLAVQEIHRRYTGSDEHYRRLVDSTLEVVEDEVGTLRRLVSEFSGFSRLPRARLEEADLAEFLTEQRERLAMLEEDYVEADEPTGDRPSRVDVEFDLPAERAPVYIDRQLLRRALINLVRNAAQATRDAGRTPARVRLRLRRDGDFWVVDIDDDGPGIPEALRSSIFDPYVTTKTEGTGLGLAIAKKIVIEHAGSIVALTSPLGGARIRVRLPGAGTAVGRAALESSHWESSPSSRGGG
jgi:two-component system nitrogen regulation sensor histidine kinase NtrY